MAKLLSSQVAERVTSLAVELSGYGYTKEYRSEVLSRREDWHDLRSTATCSEYDREAPLK